MYTKRTVFHSSRCQVDRIGALTSYASSRGCRVHVERPLNRLPGTKVVSVTGSLTNIWMVALCSKAFALGLIERPFRLHRFAT